MKHPIYLILFFLVTLSNALSQENDLDRIIWKSEIEKVVFKKITDLDTDTTCFVEAFLIFQVKKITKPDVSIFILFENGSIDSSLNKPGRLYSTSFFTKTIIGKLTSQTESYFVQPLLYGKTRDIGERVIDPDFYVINKLPMLALTKNKDINTIFFSQQLNYSYTVRRKKMP